MRQSGLLCPTMPNYPIYLCFDWSYHFPKEILILNRMQIEVAAADAHFGRHLSFSSSIGDSTPLVASRFKE